jgi:predicted phosphoadenosine phosphosulfate sulfurtransferase
VNTRELLRKISVPSLGSRISWICNYFTRVVNQSIGGCDHGFTLSLLSYCHYMKVFMTRPMMDMVC